MDRIRKQSALQEVERVSELEFSVQSHEAAHTARNAGLAHLQLLWDHKTLLWRVTLWSLAISTLVAFLIPRRFESSVSIMPPDSMNNNATMLAAIAAKTSPQLAAMASNLLGNKTTGALFTELLRSRTVQEHIVERFQLQKVYWKKYREDARKKLDDRTSISEDRKSGVITVELTDGDPQRARAMAQAYIDELNRLLAQVSTSSARRERIFIEQRLVAVKEDLNDAEKRFGSFASKNATLDIKEQTRAMVQSAAELQGQLIAAESQLQGLQQIYTNNNVRVRSLRAQVAELKRQLQKVGGSDASGEISGSQSGSQNEGLPSGELYPPIRKLPVLGVEWADLYRRMKIQETVYELLNQQYELARIQEAKEISTVNVIDPADYPEKKSFPPRLLLIVLGSLMSLAGAAGIVLLTERWNQIHPADPKKVLLESAGKGLQLQFNKLRHWPVIRRIRRSKSGDASDPIGPAQEE